MPKKQVDIELDPARVRKLLKKPSLLGKLKSLFKNKKRR